MRVWLVDGVRWEVGWSGWKLGFRGLTGCCEGEEGSQQEDEEMQSRHFEVRGVRKGLCPGEARGEDEALDGGGCGSPFACEAG